MTDGLEQVQKAYEAGWAGVIMKTAFDNVPIHIPAEYMFSFSPSTYANADNVSGHPLERVCREIKQLVKRWPDRLTMASTGGPVSGHDESDKAGWQSNTRKLEAAGAMGIEYSLSCPQGGDGAEGDIVSQNAELAAEAEGMRVSPEPAATAEELRALILAQHEQLVSAEDKLTTTQELEKTRSNLRSAFFVLF